MQHVDAPELFFGAPRHGFDRFRPADVAQFQAGGPAGLADQAHGFRRRRLVHINNDYLGFFPREQDRGGAADSISGAGDDGNLAVHVPHKVLF